MSDWLRWLRTVYFLFCFPFMCVITVRSVVCSIFASSFLALSFLRCIRNLWWFIDEGKQKWIPVFRGGNIFGYPLPGWIKSVCHDFPEYFLPFLISLAVINTSKHELDTKQSERGICTSQEGLYWYLLLRKRLGKIEQKVSGVKTKSNEITKNSNKSSKWRHWVNRFSWHFRGRSRRFFLRMAPNLCTLLKLTISIDPSWLQLHISL